MYLSLNWLKDFVQIPKTMKPEELAKAMTLHTVEVEGTAKQGEKFNNVIVGKILHIEKHPNADRLQVAKVNVGKEELQIVCGAPNIAVGQLVPVALVGAVLPNGLEIKEAEVRGVKSYGMMCAADELGIGNDHAGIYLLDKKAQIGQPFAEYLQLDDVVLEVDNKSLTNRPDLWSHMGMARDIAAFLDVKFKPYEVPANIFKQEGEEMKVSVKIEDTKLCPRYMAIAIDGIKIEKSPKWMQDRLVAAGVRPISNIVDITNYVMLELGQPMHAFDRDLAKEIIVRRAKKGEMIETLDGAKRQLADSDLVIANKEKAVAIAGIMGSANSEISDTTTTIIFESANFDPVAVRKTSTRLGLRTESLMRFEKSLDPNLCELAIARAVDLTKQIIPGVRVISDMVDIKNFSLNQGPIEFDLKVAIKKISDGITEKMIMKTLDRLGFKYEKTGHVLRLTVPTWRATKDISISEDVIEEIVRIYGYDNIPAVMPEISMQGVRFSEEKRLERRIRESLSSGASLSEVYNYSFVGEDQLKKMGIDYSKHIRLANPISALHSLLRQSLAPNILANIKTNQARYDSVGIFEIGNIYLSSAGEINKNDSTDEKLPYQEKRLGIAIAGGNDKEAYSRIKGVIEYLLVDLGLLPSFAQTSAIGPWAQSVFATDIIVGGKMCGNIMKLDNYFAKQNGIKKEVVIAEINLRILENVMKMIPPKMFSEFEKFPPLIRDLAFVIDSNILYNDLRQAIMSFSPLIKQVDLFDVYEGDKLGHDKRSLAFHVVYQADRTLTTEEVDAVQSDLIRMMAERFSAQIRNF